MRRHLPDPLFEERPGVMWARPGLGVELQRAGSEPREVEALDGSVVERDVRDLLRGAGPDREAMVLARHEHPVGPLVENWVVGAAVAEGQLVGLVPGRERKELV